MKGKRIWILLGTGLTAAAGFVLRGWQARRGLVPGDVSVWCLGLLCAAAAAALAAVCRGLEKREVYTESFSSGTAELAVSLAGAALVLAGALLGLLRGEGRLVPALGVLAALCFGATAWQRSRGTVPLYVFHAAPCLYLVVKLILEFKQWSVDPAVLDYCFDLFFAISAMCAVFHLGSFCFDKGQRRVSVFWCLSCVVFAAVGLADGGLARCLLLAGMGVWTGCSAWQLLED